MTRVWHPGIEAEGGPAFADVDPSAVGVMRNAGWMLASERDEHVDRVAAHPSQNRPDGDADGDSPKAKRPARGQSAGQSGSEGS
jgi:hypothetical protein